MYSVVLLNFFRAGMLSYFLSPEQSNACKVVIELPLLCYPIVWLFAPIYLVFLLAATR